MGDSRSELPRDDSLETFGIHPLLATEPVFENYNSKQLVKLLIDTIERYLRDINKEPEQSTYSQRFWQALANHGAVGRDRAKQIKAQLETMNNLQAINYIYKELTIANSSLSKSTTLREMLFKATTHYLQCKDEEIALSFAVADYLGRDDRIFKADLHCSIVRCERIISPSIETKNLDDDFADDLFSPTGKCTDTILLREVTVRTVHKLLEDKLISEQEKIQLPKP